jgi:hypothetical protein
MKTTLFAVFLSLMYILPLQGQPDRHVILVIIDGARYSETLGDPLARYIPRMHALAQQGVVVDTMVNDSITVTKRAIPAIWSGSWSIPHDTTVNGALNQYATAPTVWEYFRKSRNLDSTHALYVMVWLSTPWIQSYHPQYGPAYWPWYLLQGYNDREVWLNAKMKLQTYHPELSVIYLADVDAAPSKGWNAYTQSIVTADSIVGTLWDYIQGDPVYKNTTTLLVTNDHGRHLDGVQNGFISHGDGCWGCRHIMFLGVGTGMPKGLHSSARRTIADIAPTIGSLLNFATPFATGKPMTDILTGVQNESQMARPPITPELMQNYPNPFNPNTTIQYQVPKRSWISLKVFNALGKEIATLVESEREAGYHQARWEGAPSSGVYFYRLSVGEYLETKKMILLK